jgi:hypothetical protein
MVAFHVVERVRGIGAGERATRIAVEESRPAQQRAAGIGNFKTQETEAETAAQIEIALHRPPRIGGGIELERAGGTRGDVRPRQILDQDFQAAFDPHVGIGLERP